MRYRLAWVVLSKSVGSGETKTVTVNLEHDFIPVAMQCASTGRATGRFFMANTWLNSDHCDLAALFGKDGNLVAFPADCRPQLPKGGTIKLEITDLSSATNVVYLAILGKEVLS